MTNTRNSMATQKLVMCAVLTAIVVVLQYVSIAIRFGTFSITLALVPMAIGAAMYGPKLGAWLGFVFGSVVLLSGDAAPFLAVNTWGTIITVLVKGTMAGLVSGLVYKALARFNRTLATVVAALMCPLVNTGVFLLGCFVFFMETITLWAGGSDNVAAYIIVGFVGTNFLIEFIGNAIISPVMIRILNILNKL